ncbi:MAG: hypothetical protein K6F48_10680, partial [Paludibacteraceae bacterium]|nr:hypothetical protein [Paludibacteraceae bacterium]
SIATGSEVGKYGMTFTKDDFENLNHNFGTVNITVVEDSMERPPSAVNVTITKHGRTHDYDGQEHSVSGYFFNDTATTEIYTLPRHAALPIYSIATGSEVGKYGMTFTKDDFENLNHNFGTVNITVVEDSLEITPITVNVTITKHGLTQDYDGQEHSVSGYDFTSDNTLFERSDLTFTGAVSDSIATGTLVGRYGISFTRLHLGTASPNYTELILPVVEDSLEITPIAVNVTITKHGLTQDYDGQEHSVSGYDFTSDNTLFERSDLRFTGTIADSTATGTTVGKYGMTFAKDDFENLNHNFGTVNITIVEDSLEITPISVNVSITKHGLTHDYDGQAHSVSGYDFASDNDLFVRGDLTFTGAVSDSIATGTLVGKYGMTFTKDNFRNDNPNFSEVNITVVEDSLEIRPVDGNVGKASSGWWEA